MVGLCLCLISIVATAIAARRSLGTGIQALIVIGYFYGVGRGRSPDTFTHFPFDCALVTLYAVHFFSGGQTPEQERRSETARNWTRLLVIWPCLCLAYGSLLDTAQPFAVQVVGLRAAILMVPCLILGAQLSRADLDKIALAFAVMNLVALGFGLAEYFLGIEAILPRNVATEENIYRAHDIYVGGEAFYRIPGMFITSHVYGGVMIGTVPFLIHGLELGRRGRLLCMAGIGAAILGVFICGARTPVLILGLAMLYMLLTMRARSSTIAALVLVGAAGYYAVTHNERLQRFQTLGDTDYVSTRVASSVNTSLFQAIADYPIGAGLATANGTNVPYFLHESTRPPIGIESEYGHMAVEQGIPGLLILVGLVFHVLTRRKAPIPMSRAAVTLTGAIVTLTWLDGLVGVGLLSSLPGTAYFLILTGMRLADPPPLAAGLALRHVGGPAPRRRSIGRAVAPAP